MNFSTAIFLMNDHVRAIMVTYEAHEGAPRTMFKTFDKSIKADDIVVVPTDTRHKMTAVKVVEVDVQPDLESDVKVNWIIGRVNVENAMQISAIEEAAIQQIRDAEKLKKKNELQASLKALLESNGKSVSNLAIANLNDGGEVIPVVGTTTDKVA